MVDKTPRDRIPISTPISDYDDYIDLIAEKAAEKAIVKMTNKMYQEVGQSIVKKLFWIVGAVAVGLYVWLKGKGII